MMNEMYLDNLIEGMFDDVRFLTLSNNGNLIGHKVTNSYPFMDIFYNKDEDLVFNVALAGYKKENISVELNNNVITISGKYEFNNDTVKDIVVNGIKKESFSKAYSLPDGYSSEPDVMFENGVLVIIFKKDEAKKKKVLTIK